MLLPHHLVVWVDEVSAPVVVSSLVELWPVRHPALSVVDSHLGLSVLTTRYDDSILHLDTTGGPDEEMILVCIDTFTTFVNALSVFTYLHPADRHRTHCTL